MVDKKKSENTAYNVLGSLSVKVNNKYFFAKGVLKSNSSLYSVPMTSIYFSHGKEGRTSDNLRDYFFRIVVVDVDNEKFKSRHEKDKSDDDNEKIWKAIHSLSQEEFMDKLKKENGGSNLPFCLVATDYDYDKTVKGSRPENIKAMFAFLSQKKESNEDVLGIKNFIQSYTKKTKDNFKKSSELFNKKIIDKFLLLYFGESCFWNNSLIEGVMKKENGDINVFTCQEDGEKDWLSLFNVYGEATKKEIDGDEKESLYVKGFVVEIDTIGKYLETDNVEYVFSIMPKNRVYRVNDDKTDVFKRAVNFSFDSNKCQPFLWHLSEDRVSESIARLKASRSGNADSIDVRVFNNELSFNKTSFSARIKMLNWGESGPIKNILNDKIGIKFNADVSVEHNVVKKPLNVKSSFSRLNGISIIYSQRDICSVLNAHNDDNFSSQNKNEFALKQFLEDKTITSYEDIYKNYSENENDVEVESNGLIDNINVISLSEHVSFGEINTNCINDDVFSGNIVENFRNILSAIKKNNSSAFYFNVIPEEFIKNKAGDYVVPFKFIKWLLQEQSDKGDIIQINNTEEKEKVKKKINSIIRDKDIGISQSDLNALRYCFDEKFQGDSEEGFEKFLSRMDSYSIMKYVNNESFNKITRSPIDIKKVGEKFVALQGITSFDNAVSNPLNEDGIDHMEHDYIISYNGKNVSLKENIINKFKKKELSPESRMTKSYNDLTIKNSFLNSDDTVVIPETINKIEFAILKKVDGKKLSGKINNLIFLENHIKELFPDNDGERFSEILKKSNNDDNLITKGYGDKTIYMISVITFERGKDGSFSKKFSHNINTFSKKIDMKEPGAGAINDMLSPYGFNINPINEEQNSKGYDESFVVKVHSEKNGEYLLSERNGAKVLFNSSEGVKSFFYALNETTSLTQKEWENNGEDIQKKIQSEYDSYFKKPKSEKNKGKGISNEIGKTQTIWGKSIAKKNILYRRINILGKEILGTFVSSPWSPSKSREFVIEILTTCRKLNKNGRWETVSEFPKEAEDFVIMNKNHDLILKGKISNQSYMKKVMRTLIGD